MLRAGFLTHVIEKMNPEEEKSKAKLPLESVVGGGRKNPCIVLLQEFKETSFSNNSFKIV